MTPFGFPAESYHCLLDEQPHYLVPERLLPELDLDQELMVNPSCWFSWMGALPPDKACRVQYAEHFCPGDWVVWTDDPATHALWPFWIGVEYSGYMAEMEPGARWTYRLPDEVQSVLMHAGILVPPGYAARRRKQWLDTLWEASPSFQQGYVPLGGLIHPYHLGALRRYYRYHIRNGSFVLGDEQVGRRFASHNENVARYFHSQLTRVVADVAKVVVKPSYCYSVAYQEGAELHKHTDRDACEYSVTLCFDASPEPEEASPWPIQVETERGEEQIWQCIGDALLYRGREVPHWRDPLGEGMTSSSLLLHYVDESFDESLN